MKIGIMVLIILFAFTLFAEDSLRVKTNALIKSQERVRIRTQEQIQKNDSEDQDVFVDKNGDGIADDRYFQERHRDWKRYRKLSGKIFRSGSLHELHEGQSGEIIPGQNNGTGTGSGSGGR